MGINQSCKMTLISIMALTSFACTQGHCRRMADAPEVVVPTESSEAAVKAASEPKKDDRVLVYKYDGSLQCKMGKAVAVDTMAKELQGIPIFSSSKRPDGLIHIQVCGSITGSANVYEIATTNLKKAESRGFKKWSFE